MLDVPYKQSLIINGCHRMLFVFFERDSICCSQNILRKESAGNFSNSDLDDSDEIKFVRSIMNLLLQGYSTCLSRFLYQQTSWGQCAHSVAFENDPQGLEWVHICHTKIWAFGQLVHEAIWHALRTTRALLVVGHEEETLIVVGTERLSMKAEWPPKNIK